MELNAKDLKTFFIFDVKKLDLLNTYFGEFEPRLRNREKDNHGKYIDNGFTGKYFEHYAKLSSPGSFDGNDIAAVTCLSIRFDNHMVGSISALKSKLDTLIKKLPAPGKPIWDVDEDVFKKTSELSQIYELLSGLDRVGSVTASKLLAAKRPHLVPIRDTEVAKLFGNPKSWWIPWFEAMQDKGLRDRLEEYQKKAKLPHVSLLRIADVILWMSATR